MDYHRVSIDNNQGKETYPTWETKSTTISRNSSRKSTKSSNNSTMNEGTRSSPNNPTTTTTTSESSTFTSDTAAVVPKFTEPSRNPRDQQQSSSSSSSPRSRSASAWDTHRISSDQDVWRNDKERKHKKIMDKLFGNKLVPHFLK